MAAHRPPRVLFSLPEVRDPPAVEMVQRRLSRRRDARHVSQSAGSAPQVRQRRLRLDLRRLSATAPCASRVCLLRPGSRGPARSRRISLQRPLQLAQAALGDRPTMARSQGSPARRQPRPAPAVHPEAAGRTVGGRPHRQPHRAHRQRLPRQRVCREAEDRGRGAAVPNGGQTTRPFLGRHPRMAGERRVNAAMVWPRRDLRRRA